MGRLSTARFLLPSLLSFDIIKEKAVRKVNVTKRRHATIKTLAHLASFAVNALIDSGFPLRYNKCSKF